MTFSKRAVGFRQALPAEIQQHPELLTIRYPNCESRTFVLWLTQSEIDELPGSDPSRAPGLLCVKQLGTARCSTHEPRNTEKLTSV